MENNSLGFDTHENGFIEFDKVFAVDGDIVAYRTAAVCEDFFEGSAYAILQSTLSNIANLTGVTKMRIYLSGKSNFRYDVAKTKPYKGNRATMVRPQFLPACRDYLIENCNAVVVEGFEADDAIATDMTINGAYHCGIDKDILQIPGRHYNYVKDEWTDVTEDQAIINLYRQILKGDASDNIPGLPKVGDKGAANTVVDAATALDNTMDKYKEVVGLRLPGVNWLEYLSEQSRLITMVKNVPLDFSKIHEVKLADAGFTTQENGFVDFNTPKQETKKPILL